MKKLVTRLLIIDPQYDFCDPKGSLFVKGADQDMLRLAAFINKGGKVLDDIIVTLDSHLVFHIAHPKFWKNSEGNNPAPFTLISADAVAKGEWMPVIPSYKAAALAYVKALQNNGRYVLCIWPEHCLIGSLGATVYAPVDDALRHWCWDFTAVPRYCTKGSNFSTEHYSAIQADVPDPSDAGTQPNTDLIATLQSCDELLIGGEALSHCLANTIRDVVSFGQEHAKKFVLLEDCCSNVTGFEKLGQDFIKDMKAIGLRVTTSKDYLA